MANNSARYEFAGQMLAQNFHGIKYAITGQRVPSPTLTKNDYGNDTWN